jgi:hypothetical protein
MKKSSVYFLMVLYLCWDLHVLAQTATYKKDILNACANLLSSGTYSVQLDYKLFLDNNLGTPFQTRSVKIVKDNKNLYVSQNHNIELIRMGRYFVFLDHKKKMIAAKAGPTRTSDTDQAKQMLSEISDNLDSLLKTTSKVEKILENNERVKYQCHFRSESIYRSATIELDKKTGFYASLTTSYKHPFQVKELEDENHYVTVQVDYLGLNSQPAIKSGLFEVSNYLVLNSGKITQPAKQYLRYHYFNDKY